MSDNKQIQYSGTKSIKVRELDLLKNAAEKSMDKISKISDYNRLKVAVKSHGNTTNTNKQKFSLNLLLSKGNKIVHVSREVMDSSASSDDLRQDKEKTRWSVVNTIQDAFSALEDQIKVQRGRGVF